MQELLEQVLSDLRPGLEADGVELHVEQIDEARGYVRLRRALKPDACEDCLLPGSMMATMIETALAGKGCQAKVEIED